MFLDSGKCFWILGRVFEFWEVFWILGSILLIPTSHRIIINTNETSGELSRENLVSSHVKIKCYVHM